MDHITRCPNCATAFRVSDAQLTAYQGKVRCGRCALVFNARENLLSQPAIVHPREETAIQLTPESHSTIEREIISSTLSDAEPAHGVEQLEIAEDVHRHQDSGAETSSITPALSEAEQQIGVIEAAKEKRDYRPILLPEDDALFAPLQRPRHASVWVLGSVLAVLALVAQIVFAYRLTLAMEFPALQPQLSNLCEKLGCDMPLPRQADRLRLEWSELTYVPEHPTLIQLSATVRNLANYEQALPLLELTLTDNQERILARRVFKPQDYLAGNEKNRLTLPAHDEMHAFLQLETQDLKSTGYSIYWLYE